MSVAEIVQDAGIVNTVIDAVLDIGSLAALVLIVASVPLALVAILGRLNDRGRP